MTKCKNTTKKNNGTTRKAATRGVSKSKRGSYRKPGTKGRQQLLSQAARKAFDAFHPSHLPLPVPTAPYLTVRSRVVVTTNKTLTFVGPVEGAIGGSESWQNICAIGMDANTVLGSGSVQYTTFNPPATDVETDWELTPAACSFQVACTDSLTSASGVSYLGRLKTTLSQPAGDDTRTGQDLANNIVQYSNPKCLSNAKLAMSAQQVNLLPGNMAELTDFREMQALGSSNPLSGWGSSGGTAARNFAGFKPGYIYNPYNSELVVTIAMEWRVRLAPNNPMHQSMTHYPPTNPSVWHALSKAADSTAHGVEDVGALGAAGYLASSAAGEGGLMGAFDTAMGAVGGLLPELGSVAASAAEFAPLLLL
jgi:hypothetical protein